MQRRYRPPSSCFVCEECCLVWGVCAVRRPERDKRLPRPSAYQGHSGWPDEWAGRGRPRPEAIHRTTRSPITATRLQTTWPYTGPRSKLPPKGPNLRSLQKLSRNAKPGLWSPCGLGFSACAPMVTTPALSPGEEREHLPEALGGGGAARGRVGHNVPVRFGPAPFLRTWRFLRFSDHRVAKCKSLMLKQPFGGSVSHSSHRAVGGAPTKKCATVGAIFCASSSSV